MKNDYYMCGYCGRGVANLESHEGDCYIRPEISMPEPTLTSKPLQFKPDIKNFIKQ